MPGPDVEDRRAGRRQRVGEPFELSARGGDDAGDRGRLTADALQQRIVFRRPAGGALRVVDEVGGLRQQRAGHADDGRALRPRHVRLLAEHLHGDRPQQVVHARVDGELLGLDAQVGGHGGERLERAAEARGRPHELLRLHGEIVHARGRILRRMAAYLVVHVDVTDPVRYETYKAMAPPSIRQYGGRYLTRGGAAEVLEGDWEPKRLVLLEFPSAEQARAFWHSPEYAEAKALRMATATSEMVLLEGVDAAALGVATPGSR